MYIQIVLRSKIPAFLYGGTERVVWYLGKELVRMGHRVSFLANEGSSCDFAPLSYVDPATALEDQIDREADIVHFFEPISKPVDHPHMVTIEGNIGHTESLDLNTVFVSRDHAARHNSEAFVYNGLDWDDYGPVKLDTPRAYYHFLAKAAWRVKNVQGAINTIKSIPGGKLYVLGGSRLNVKMGFRLTTTPKARFFGMVGGSKKHALIQGSKGLLFPVRWPEPFGLAITESLYFGCPVFGTPYGSLPELVSPEVGFLSDSRRELAAHMTESSYNARRCHEYARDLFNSRVMAQEYLKLYERVLNGETLNAQPPRALRPHDWPLPWQD